MSDIPQRHENAEKTVEQQKAPESDPDASGHSTADDQAQRNREDESPS